MRYFKNTTRCNNVYFLSFNFNRVIQNDECFILILFAVPSKKGKKQTYQTSVIIYHWIKGNYLFT